MLDSDSAGQSGIKDAYYKLNGCSLVKFEHLSGMKDCGDLIKLERNNPSEYEWVEMMYKTKIGVYLEDIR